MFMYKSFVKRDSHINILSYLLWIAYLFEWSDPKVLLHCFLFFALLLSLFRQLDTVAITQLIVYERHFNTIV